jgi:RNA polymerase sigma-70 factor (ECF subfamily)
LPGWARDVADTDDVVQDALARAFKRIGQFEARREGALRAYLRQAVFNRIRDEFRRAGRRPAAMELDTGVPADDASPLDQAIGTETASRYEHALQRLRPEDREAIIVRVELGSSYQDAAMALGKPSPDAARVAIGRALVKLAEEMRRAR